MPLIDSATLLTSIVDELLPILKVLILVGLVSVAVRVLLHTKVGKILALACIVVFLVNQGVK